MTRGNSSSGSRKQGWRKGEQGMTVGGRRLRSRKVREGGLSVKERAEDQKEIVMEKRS